MAILNWYVIFGDWYEAKTTGWDSFIDGGVRKIKIKIYPTEALRKKHKIKDTDMNPEGYVEKEYDEMFVGDITSAEDNQTLFLLCDYAGEPTKLIEKLNLKHKTEAENYREEVKTLRVAVKRLQYLVDMAMNHPEQFFKNVNRTYKGIKELLGVEYTEKGDGQGLEAEHL